MILQIGMLLFNVVVLAHITGGFVANLSDLKRKTAMKDTKRFLLTSLLVLLQFGKCPSLYCVPLMLDAEHDLEWLIQWSVAAYSIGPLASVSFAILLCTCCFSSFNQTRMSVCVRKMCER